MSFFVYTTHESSLLQILSNIFFYKKYSTTCLVWTEINLVWWRTASPHNQKMSESLTFSQYHIPSSNWWHQGNTFGGHCAQMCTSLKCLSSLYPCLVFLLVFQEKKISKRNEHKIYTNGGHSDWNCTDITIFTNLRLCLAIARHNLKLVKILML